MKNLDCFLKSARNVGVFEFHSSILHYLLLLITLNPSLASFIIIMGPVLEGLDLAAGYQSCLAIIDPKSGANIAFTAL